MNALNRLAAKVSAPSATATRDAILGQLSQRSTISVIVSAVVILAGWQVAPEKLEAIINLVAMWQGLVLLVIQERRATITTTTTAIVSDPPAPTEAVVTTTTREDLPA